MKVRCKEKNVYSREKATERLYGYIIYNLFSNETQEFKIESEGPASLKTLKASLEKIQGLKGLEILEQSSLEPTVK